MLGFLVHSKVLDMGNLFWLASVARVERMGREVITANLFLFGPVLPGDKPGQGSKCHQSCP